MEVGWRRVVVAVVAVVGVGGGGEECLLWSGLL